MESICKIQAQNHCLLHLSLSRPCNSSFNSVLPPISPRSPLPKTLCSPSPRRIPFRVYSHDVHRHHFPLKSLRFLKPRNQSEQDPASLFHATFIKSLGSLGLLSSLIKCISLSIAVAALVLARFSTKPSFAATPFATPTVNPLPSESDSVSEAERERNLEQLLKSRPDDVDALKSLMESRIKLRKLPQAIEAIDRLIHLQPTEKEWPLLRAHLHLYGGDIDVAKSAFEEIISADPFRVEAYHGLAMAVVQLEPDELESLLKRIGDVMELCRKEGRNADLRDFKLLVAQVSVIQDKYSDALNLYEDLVKEEPGDFRPYLCLGIIHTLTGKKDEAEKQFENYRRLVPKGHPYAQFFDDNVLATKFFSQMAEKDKEDSSSAR